MKTLLKVDIHGIVSYINLGFRPAILGLGGVLSAQLFWLLVLVVLFIFFVIKNCLATVSNEEKEKLMNKNTSVWVLSFFDAASAAMMGLVVNTVSGSIPLT